MGAFSSKQFDLDATDEEVLAHCREHYAKLDDAHRKKVAEEAETTTLCMATTENKLDLMMFLIDEKKVDVNAKDDKQNPSKDHPIMCCRKPDHPYAARLLLAAKADPNVVNGFDWTALMMNPCGFDGFHHGGTDTLQVFLKAKADVNQKTRDTAAQDAAWNGAYDCLKLLVQAKADLELRGDSDWNVLQAGLMSPNCQSEEAHLELVKFLLENGTKPNELPQDQVERVPMALKKALADHGCEMAKKML